MSAMCTFRQVSKLLHLKDLPDYRNQLQTIPGIERFVAFMPSTTNPNGFRAKFQDFTDSNSMLTTGNIIVLDDNPSPKSTENILRDQETGSKQRMEINDTQLASESVRDNDSITTIPPVSKDCYGSNGDTSYMLHVFWPYVMKFIRDNPHHDHSKQWDTWMEHGLSQHSGLADVKQVMGIDTISQLFLILRAVPNEQISVGPGWLCHLSSKVED